VINLPGAPFLREAPLRWPLFCPELTMWRKNINYKWLDEFLLRHYIINRPTQDWTDTVIQLEEVFS